MSSPVIVVSSMLAALGLWSIFAAYGVLLGATPGVMALLWSLPPIHSFFLDLRLVAGGPAVTGPVVALAALAVLALRAFMLGFWTALITDALRGVRRSWRDSVRRAAGLASASFRSLFAIEAGFLLVALVALFLSLGFLGAGLGQLAVLASLVASLYFLVFTPIIATLEGGSIRWIAKASARAGRVPGPRHMLLAVAYLALVLFVSTLTPGSRVSEATPSIAVWAYVLLVGVLHLAVLGALVYRWLLVREGIRADVADEAGAPQSSPRAGALDDPP